MKRSMWILCFGFLALANAEMEGMFSIPAGCADEDCTYKATWKSMPGSMVDFTVMAKVETGMWAGIGFSRDGRMIGSDAVVAWMTSTGQQAFTDRFLRGKSPSLVPVDSTEKGTILKSLSHMNGMLNCSFSRAIDTGDSMGDISFKEELFIIYAWGGRGSPNGRSITVHTSQGNIGRRVMFDDIPGLPSPMSTAEITTMPTPPPPPMPSDGDKGMEKVPADRDMKEEPAVGSRSLTGSTQVSTSCEQLMCPPNSDCMMIETIAFCFCKPGYAVDSVGNCMGGSDPMPDKCAGVNCPANAMCKAGMCECMPNYMMQSDGSCMAMDRCAEKTCPDNAMCKDGACSCMSGYSLHSDGRCKAVSTASTDNCAGQTCPRYSKCRQGFCFCDPGYEPHSSGQCKAIQSTSMDKCRDVKCTAKYSMCKDGMCHCMDGHKRQSDGTCKGDMKMCTSNSQCKKKYTMCMNGMCRCMSGYKRHSDGSCKGDMKMCHSHDQCKRRYSICINGMCRCLPGYSHHSDGSCRAIHSTSMDKCKDVICTAKHSMCKNGMCHCMDGYKRQGDGTCKGDMKMCISSGQCKQKYSMCMNGMCRCMRGYSHHSDGSCKAVHTTHMNMCTINAQCKKKYSTCMNGMCHCMPGYKRHSDGSCKGDMKKCSRIHPCKQKYSMCMNGMCHCMPGYMHHSDGSCKARKPMRPMCGGRRCYEHAECRMGKCYCKAGYVDIGGACRKHSPSHSRCQGHCGAFDRQRSCSCSHLCVEKNNCCSDYRQHCMHIANRFFGHGR